MGQQGPAGPQGEAGAAGPQGEAGTSFTCTERRILARNAALPYDAACRPTIALDWVGPTTPFVITGSDFNLRVTNNGPITVDGLSLSGSPDLFGSQIPTSPNYRLVQTADTPHACITAALATGDSCTITVSRGAFGYALPVGTFTMTVTPWFGAPASHNVTTQQ